METLCYFLAACLASPGPQGSLSEIFTSAPHFERQLVDDATLEKELLARLHDDMPIEDAFEILRRHGFSRQDVGLTESPVTFAGGCRQLPLPQERFIRQGLYCWRLCPSREFTIHLVYLNGRLIAAQAERPPIESGIWRSGDNPPPVPHYQPQPLDDELLEKRILVQLRHDVTTRESYEIYAKAILAGSNLPHYESDPPCHFSYR